MRRQPRPDLQRPLVGLGQARVIADGGSVFGSESSGDVQCAACVDGPDRLSRIGKDRRPADPIVESVDRAAAERADPPRRRQIRDGGSHRCETSGEAATLGPQLTPQLVPTRWAHLWYTRRQVADNPDHDCTEPLP